MIAFRLDRHENNELAGPEWQTIKLQPKPRREIRDENLRLRRTRFSDRRAGDRAVAGIRRAQAEPACRLVGGAKFPDLNGFRGRRRMRRFFGSARQDPPLDPAAPDGWHESDLELIDAVGGLGEIALLSLNFKYTPARALSHVKHRVGHLYLSEATDQTLADVATLPDFKELAIYDSQFSPAGFQRLAEWAENVESLGFWRYWPAEWRRGIRDDDLANFTRLEKLKKLHIEGSPITSAGIEQVARMTNLTELTLENCPARGADFKPLARLVRLQELTIWPSRKHDDKASLADRATDADPDQLSWGDAIAQVVACLPELQTLSLEMPIRKQGLRALVESGKLRSVTLELDEVNDESLALVSRLARLGKLHLCGRGKLSDAGLVHLGKLTEFFVVQLPGAGITDSGLLPLAGLDTISSLGLPGSEITGNVFGSMRAMEKPQIPFARELSLWGRRLSSPREIPPTPSTGP